MKVLQKNTTTLHGITASLAKRKLHKCQRQLGNGHDAELHLTIADIYQHLGEEALALASYRAAEASVLKQPQRDASVTERLIALYKRILALSPYDETVIEKLSQEYARQGKQYKAASLHTELAQRYIRHGEYQKAVAQFQRMFAIEPNSITARTACAETYCQLGDKPHAAVEYAHIGDIYFEHQRFDGALGYYQQASTLDPSNLEVQQKILTTQHILEGTIIPQAQATLQKLQNLTQDMRHSLSEKERIEQELRQNIHLLKQRYKQSFATKNDQLNSTRKRLEELSIYVTVFKENLKKIAIEKRSIQAQLDDELRQRKELEQKLERLNILSAQATPAAPSNAPSEELERLASANKRLEEEKTKLEQQLYVKLEQSTQREQELREHMETQMSTSVSIEGQFKQFIHERNQVQDQLQQQLQESHRREHGLQEQIRELITQHEDALAKITHTTRACVTNVEQETMTALEQLHGELSRQYDMECDFSARFHESLHELTDLLLNQEQEIRQLECL